MGQEPKDSGSQPPESAPRKVAEIAAAALARLKKFFPEVRRRLPAIGRGLRRLILPVAAGVGTVIVLLLVMLGSAAWYTSRSEFCSSCHIMQPYYKSWQESSHRNVACIKCHFPPGVAEEVRGKMLGLVQLAKYVTQSQGPRPAAEVSDASCLRVGCHETRLLSGKVNFHGIPFDHTHHLGEERRGKKLRCTSCHSQIVQGRHMAVTTSTCFLCHFKDGLFNEGLGACTRCHQIPSKKFDLGGGVMFTHDLAYEKGVDCANCHGDLIRGNGEVPQERCLVCHNREGDLKRINDHAFMHRVHVTEHAVNCLACHLEIQHSLQKDKIERAASQCTSCHPDHHQEQIAMLEGTGSKLVPNHANEMLAVRLECKTCHRAKAVSASGAVVWKGSAEECAMCHEASKVAKLMAYHRQMRAELPELDAAIQRVRKALESTKLAADRVAAMQTALGAIEHDFEFLRAANDIHNIHYASKLNQTLWERIAGLCRELKIAEPKALLPSMLGPGK
jgi:nitrate/TMAO reductase-like tetraheme cytochrome c subunit